MTATPADGVALANRIRDWLRLSRQGEPTPELAKFIEALENWNRVPEWAGVNFERVLPLRVPASRFMRVCTVIRNALVFLPIVLTWLALADASKLFVERTQQGDENVNFLVVWQNATGWSSLSTVATIDALIIVFLIALTLLIGTREESQSFTRKIERAHEGLMVELERNLSGYRYLSLKDLNTTAGDTVKALKDAADLIEVATTQLADSATTANETVQAVQDAVASSVQPLLAQLQAVTNGLQGAVGTHDQMAALVLQFQQEFQNEAQKFHAGVQNSVMAISSSLTSATAAVVDSMNVAMRDLDATAKSLVLKAQNSADDISTRFADDISTRMNSLSVAMNDAAENLDLANTNFRATIASVEFGLQQMREDMDNLGRSIRNITGSGRS